jgi:short-subunit dehydrogenase
MKFIHGKRILITGASTGIGKSTAKLLAANGAKLILVSKCKSRLLQTSREIKHSLQMVEEPLILTCDVSNYEEVKEMIYSSWMRQGPIDILINNAGMGVFGAFEAHDIWDIETQLKVNFLGAVYCMHEVIPLMKEAGGGLILNVSSIASFHGIPYIGAYAASKAALSSICQSIRAELNGQNIDLKIIYPGYADTDFFKNEK